MTDPIRPRPIRSTHGLTRCRACRAHIHAADVPSRTVCPFCGENQLGIPRAKARGRIVAVGRGGVMAAGLLAFSAFGCGQTETAEPVAPPVIEQPTEPEAVLPMEPMPIEPNPIEPEPVAPPVTPEPIAQPRPRPRPRPQPTPQPSPVPAYGIPPGDQWQQRPAPPPINSARYGIAPMRRDRRSSEREEG